MDAREQLGRQWFEQQDFNHSNILLMSSGNYDGLDIFSLAKHITQS